jgi:hypothetical protein
MASLTRGLKQRIQKLEGDRGNQGTPATSVATCPIPETDLPLRPETIERWLAAGLAHIAFRGHVVLYDGGQRHPSRLRNGRCCIARPRITKLKSSMPKTHLVLFHFEARHHGHLPPCQSATFEAVSGRIRF